MGRNLFPQIDLLFRANFFPQFDNFFWSTICHCMSLTEYLSTLFIISFSNIWFKTNSFLLLIYIKSLYESYWPFFYILSHFLFHASDYKPAIRCHYNLCSSICKWQQSIILCFVCCIDTLIQLWCYKYSINLFYFINIFLKHNLCRFLKKRKFNFWFGEEFISTNRPL